MRLFYFTFFFLLIASPGFSIEIAQFWIIEQDHGKLEWMKKKEKPVFKKGETLYLLFDLQKALLQNERGEIRWYFEFYIEGKLNTRLKPEVLSVKKEGESFNYWKVLWWKIPRISGQYKVFLFVQDKISGKKEQQNVQFKVFD